MIMKKLFFAGLGLILLTSQIALASISDTTLLRSKPVYGKEAKVVTYILDNNHYRKITLGDSLSSVILDEYVKGLDNNKTYFTTEDLKGFEKYRDKMDDLIRSENVEAAYAIYNLFRKRFDERMNYIMKNLITQKFDYNVDETYETDRDKEPWCKNEAELNEVWRKMIKSQ